MSAAEETEYYLSFIKQGSIMDLYGVYRSREEAVVALKNLDFTYVKWIYTSTQLELPSNLFDPFWVEEDARRIKETEYYARCAELDIDNRRIASEKAFNNYQLKMHDYTKHLSEDSSLDYHKYIQDAKIAHEHTQKEFYAANNDTLMNSLCEALRDRAEFYKLSYKLKFDTRLRSIINPTAHRCGGCNELITQICVICDM